MSIRKTGAWVAMVAVAAAIVFGWRWIGNPRQNRAKAAAPDFVELLSAWQERLDGDFPSADLPQEPLIFPADHGAHPDVPAERWEVLAELQTGDRRFAVRLQLDRLGARPESARSSRWAAHEFFHSTVSFSDLAEQRSLGFEHSARNALGLSGHSIDPLRVWLGGNGLEWRPTTAELALTIRESGLVADLDVDALKPPAVLPQGVSGNGRWRAYVLPRNRIFGSLKAGERVLPVTGIGWFTHAWGALPPVGGQIAFDRWTLLLDNGTEFALREMRRRDGRGTPAQQGLRFVPDGSVEVLDSDQPLLQAMKYRQGFPAEWRLRVPARAIDLKLSSAAWNWVEIPGWGRREAAILVQGTADGMQCTGWGFVELETAEPDSARASKR